MLAADLRVLNEIFDALAGRHSGEMVRRAGALARYPEVVFRHKGVDAVVEVASGAGGEHDLVLHVIHRGKARSPGYTIRLHRVDPWRHRFERWIGRFGIRRNTQRPGWFRLETGDASDIVRYVGGDVAAPIVALWGIDQVPHILVAMTASLFLVRRTAPLWSEETLGQFIELSLAVYDASAIPPPPPPLAEERGVWLLPAIVRSLESPHCGVCGEAIGRPRAVCVGCRTPHHTDCWHWTGVCSVYACGSERFRVE